MTPRERLMAALRGEPVDRVPLNLLKFDPRATQSTTDAGEREILERIGHELHFFHSCSSPVNRFLVTPAHRIREVDREERGGQTILSREIDTPKGPLTTIAGRNEISRTSWMIKYPVETMADIEKIRSVPWERPPQLVTPDYAPLPEGFDTQGITHTTISSPVVCVAAMMNYEWFLELCITELDLIRDLTAICRDRILDTLDVLLAEKNIEYVWMGGCEWLTPPMGSPRLYEELVQPYERDLIERIHEGGALCHVHCHGNIRSTLELIVERGADFTEPVEPPPDGDIPFAEAKALAAGRITLGGNVESRVLESEDADATETATRAAFEGGTERMILQQTEGPISRMSPRMVENYHRMIDVWEELSPIG